MTDDRARQRRIPGLERIVPHPRSGEDRFRRGAAELPLRLVEYWRWSASDLLGNAQRGVLAEFIVASALDAADGVRVEWDAYDLVTPEGTKVEVKSAAYVQSWAQEELSRISYDIAPKLSWDAASNEVSETELRSADVYVFALLGDSEGGVPDPMDLEQWSFLVLAARVLDEKVGSQKTITLGRLRGIGACPASFSSLKARVQEQSQGA